MNAHKFPAAKVSGNPGVISPSPCMKGVVGRCLFEARATHAPHRAVFHRLGLSVGIAIALAGCLDKSELREQSQRFAEGAIESSTRHCIDGVSYIATLVRGGYVLTPHLKPDGKPHTCGATQ